MVNIEVGGPYQGSPRELLWLSPESLLSESFSQGHPDIPGLHILSLLPFNPQFSVFTWSGVTLGPVSRLVFILRLVFVSLPE